MTKRQRRMVLASIGVLLAAACGMPDATIQPREPAYWPTESWQYASPESQGVDSHELADMVAQIGTADSGVHSLVVVRHGYVILDAAFFPYDGATPHDVASVTKSVTSTLLGAAIESGVLGSLDRSVVDMLGVNPADLDDPAKVDITLSDLVAMRAGFDCGLSPGEPELKAMMASSDWIDFALSLPLSEPPGVRFAYCSPGFHLLSAAITEATGEPASDLAVRRLFKPLGIVPGDWPIGPSGYNHGWGDLRLHPLDLAKIGFLFLHGGRWDETRIVPEGWVQEVTRSRGPVGSDGVGYGLGWWIPGGDLEDVFEARGRGGQGIIVIPHLDLVVVTTGAGFKPGVIAPFLNTAIKNGPLPDNDIARARLDDALERARTGADPVPVLRQPSSTARISGRVYDMEPNALGFEVVSFDFSDPEAARLRFELSAAMGPSADGSFDLSIGLDGRYKISPEGPRGYDVGLKGAWRDSDHFDLDYVEPAGANAFTMRFDFVDDDRISVELRDKAGLFGKYDLMGTLRQP